MQEKKNGKTPPKPYLYDSRSLPRMNDFMMNDIIKCSNVRDAHTKTARKLTHQPQPTLGHGAAIKTLKYSILLHIWCNNNNDNRYKIMPNTHGKDSQRRPVACRVGRMEKWGKAILLPPKLFYCVADEPKWTRPSIITLNIAWENEWILRADTTTPHRPRSVCVCVAARQIYYEIWTKFPNFAKNN